MQCVSCDAELTPGARFCAACAAPAPQSPGDPSDALRTALEKALGFQYVVLRLLGRGGMGAVYLARELALDREVAIKVLPPERGADEEGHARFRREARTAARLSHPHIVPLLTFGEVAGLAYYVMHYVRGESLAARLGREGRLAPEETARILAEIADALGYAHRQGVVHRDLKPDNVLVDEESGRAMLTDFGIARARGSQALTGTGMIVGTPRYMSPEQAAGAPGIDGRSDLYALGLMGYEMVSGAAAFDAPTPAEQVLQRLSRDPAPLAPRAPEAPAWLTGAIMKCLERDPAARWPDARALRQQLLSGGTESDLPVALGTLNLVAQVAALTWGYGAGHALWRLATRQPRVLRVFAEGAFVPDPLLASLSLVPLLLLLMCLDVRREGYPWAAIRRAVVRQPRWWMGWYPRRGRAPGDVWDRLAGHVRGTRVLLSTLLLLAPLVALVNAIDRTTLEHYARTGSLIGLSGWLGVGPPGLGPLLAGVCVLVAVPTLAAGARSFLRLRRGPLAAVMDNDEIWSVFLRSTGNTRFWSRPLYAGLLAPRAPAGAGSGSEASGGATVTSRVETPTRTKG
jgi:hypothetical protein